MNSYKKSVLLKWNWPINCDRILLLKAWKLSEISRFENEELVKLNPSCYQVCYKAEYELNGGFEYNLSLEDYGELRFYIMPLSKSGTQFDNNLTFKFCEFDHLSAVSTLGYPRQVKAKTRKSKVFGSPYYKIKATITCHGKGFDAGDLFYRIKGSQHLYKVPINVEIGQNDLPSILIRGDYQIEFLYKQMEKMIVV